MDPGPHRVILLDELFRCCIPVLLVPFPVNLVRPLYQLRSGLRQDAEQVNKAGQASYRGRATTEPEEVDPVAGLVVVEDEFVTLDDILRNARSRGIARQFSPTGTESPIIKRDLLLR